MAFRTLASSLNVTASAGCEMFCGADNRIHDSLKLSRPVQLSRRTNAVVAASSSCRTTVTREAAAQFSAGTADQAMRGLFADGRTSSSPSTSGRWVEHLEIESIIRNLQQGNAALDFMQLPHTIISSGYFRSDSECSMISLHPQPQPLSIHGSSGNLTTASRRSRASTLLRVAHPGAAGAHSEAASTKAYPRCHSLPCGKFEVPFLAVELGLADRAVLPIENSVGGSIHKNYDLMLRHRLHIVGEVQLAVSHCLMAMPGTRKEDLRRVLSHPQALSQCEQNLSDLGVRPEAVNDTAAAAQFVGANAVRDTGAIASAQAASLYGLSILERDFQDYAGNTTRFLMMAREPVVPAAAGYLDRRMKTSIVFALQNDSEDLFRALSAFGMRDINLTKIECRPVQVTRKPLHVVDDHASAGHGSAGKCQSTTSECFKDLFFIDLEASMADKKSSKCTEGAGRVLQFSEGVGLLPCYGRRSQLRS